jgi:hypothetical protein
MPARLVIDLNQLRHEAASVTSPTIKQATEGRYGSRPERSNPRTLRLLIIQFADWGDFRSHGRRDCRGNAC